MGIWYVCSKCAPHGMSDHSLYGDKKCLIVNCPCPGYTADENQPEKQRIPKPFISKLNRS